MSDTTPPAEPDSVSQQHTASDEGTSSDSSTAHSSHEMLVGVDEPIPQHEAVHKGTLDKIIFGVTATFAIAFVAWGLLSPKTMSSGSSTALGWVMDSMGWAFILFATCFVIFAIWLAASRYGNIPLGHDNEKPEFKTTSWIAMMFSAGMGIGLMFYGVAEPLTHFVTPPPRSGAGAESPEALQVAMATTMFHWALHPWAIYAVVGVAIAYGTFRKGRSQLISSTFVPLIGRRRAEGPVGKVIDGLAIFATLFGSAASLGLGALQIAAGLEKNGWVNKVGGTALVSIIVILTICFIFSAVSGVEKGIQYLSNFNMVLALVLAVFLFVVGPTAFILNLLPTGLGDYMDQLPFMASRSQATGLQPMHDWLASWTVFYWAWWISWTPFVGMFVARISRGRTLREFTAVTVLAPTMILILAFTIFGGTAITFHQQGVEGFDGSAGGEAVLFAMFQNLPLGQITPFILLAVLAIFFITSSDSASLVNSQLSQGGNPEPKRLVTVFWALCMAGIAAVMLLIGGQSALNGLQNLVTVSALPFAMVMIGMCVALLRDFSTDPMMIRRAFQQRAVDNAVREGVTEYGDDFKLAVEPAHGEAERWSVGKDFESTAEEYTAWYQRTDEEGEPVEFDYETNEYADDAPRERPER